MQLRQLVLRLVCAGGGLVATLACGAPDRGDCANFRACAEAYSREFDTSPPEISRYDEGGDCWSDLLVAEACRAQCTDTMKGYDEVLTAARLDAEVCNVIND